MTRRRIVKTRSYPDDWTVSTEYETHGRTLYPGGPQLSIKGERGRFRFVKHVRKADGTEWIDVIGGPDGAPAYRSFRPERIKTVHRKVKR